MSLKKRIRFFRKLIILMIILLSTVFSGVVGYMIIEGYSFVEALYMTVITVSTVGYGEVHGLSQAGRLFTLILICVNLGLFTYFIALLTQYFTDGEFVNSYKLMKMENSIQQLKDHVIICGFGRNGKQSAQVLANNDIPFVVIEEQEHAMQIKQLNLKHYIIGDATKDEVLLQAGVKNAKALLTTLPEDTHNLFVVLSAHQLNKKLVIISRASQDSSIQKLKIAGADNVIMPDKIGGAHMASLVVLPDVVEMLSLMTTHHNKEFSVSSVEVNKEALLGDLDLWRKTNSTVLGIKRQSNEYIMNPSPSAKIVRGDSLVLMGSEHEISEVRKLV